jgi:hypothetical protein
VQSLALARGLYRVTQVLDALVHASIISTSCRTVHGEVVVVACFQTKRRGHETCAEQEIPRQARNDELRRRRRGWRTVSDKASAQGKRPIGWPGCAETAHATPVAGYSHRIRAIPPYNSKGSNRAGCPTKRPRKEHIVQR